MKHIKGMLVFIGLFIWVGCAPDQEPTIKRLLRWKNKRRLKMTN